MRTEARGEMSEAMLNLREAAELIGRSHNTLRVQVFRGRIKARKFGRDWAVTRSALRAYLRSIGEDDRLADDAADEHEPAPKHGAA